MSRGVNKCIVIGNLGEDPSVKYLPSGGAVTNFNVATSEEWTDKNTGQKQSRTEWHRIVIYNKLAEIAGEYLKKGSKVYLEGSMRTRKWAAQDGSDRFTTELIISEMQMLDGRPEGSNQARAQQDGMIKSSENSVGLQAARQQPQQQNYSQQPAGFGGFDDMNEPPF